MDYGIGIVGTGMVAEVHARAIAESSGVALVSVLSSLFLYALFRMIFRVPLPQSILW